MAPVVNKKILIGYSMRSGSTLLQHMLGQHSKLRSYSDITSYLMLLELKLGLKKHQDLCVKPMDLFFLRNNLPIRRYFNKFLWLARDPRDSYVSAIESGYAYLFWPRGRTERGIDIGLLERWMRIYSHYFTNRHLWYLVRYEDLVNGTAQTLEGVFGYLDLPFEDVSHFGKFNVFLGGDYKIRKSSSVYKTSVGRHRHALNEVQQKVFQRYLGEAMKALGYV